jgi:hypothetical protein
LWKEEKEKEDRNTQKKEKASEGSPQEEIALGSWPESIRGSENAGGLRLNLPESDSGVALFEE